MKMSEGVGVRNSDTITKDLSLVTSCDVFSTHRL